MKNRRLIIILILLFVITMAHGSYAADSLTHTYPAAVLVELRTEQSRLNALKTDKKYTQLAEAEKDIAGASAAMILDFKDHFNYCPVYYFADTNENFIRKKQFEGILLNADGTPCRNMVINATSKDYVIVYYGYPTVQPHNQKTASDSAKYYNSGEPMGKGLIINNDKMQQLTYLYNMGYDAAFLNKKEKKYAYSSKHFNIEYFPSADDFNKKLRRRKNTHQMKVNRRLGE